jgi:Fe-S cluster biogenesis protein NfuA
MREKIEDILNTVRPAINADGGDVEVVDVSEDGVVQVRLVGACAGCPSAMITLQAGIERLLKQMVPEVKQVIAVP